MKASAIAYAVAGVAAVVAVLGGLAMGWVKAYRDSRDIGPLPLALMALVTFAAAFFAATFLEMSGL